MDIRSVIARSNGTSMCSLEETAKLSSKVAEPFCNPTSNEMRVPIAPHPLVLSVFWI